MSSASSSALQGLCSKTEAPNRSISIGDGHSIPPVSEALQAIDYVHGEPQRGSVGTRTSDPPSKAMEPVGSEKGRQSLAEVAVRA